MIALLLTLSALAEPALDVAAARDAEGLVVALGSYGIVSVEQGAVIPIVDDEETVGLAVVGDAHLALTLPRRRDREALANRRVLWHRAAREPLRPFVDGTEPLPISVDRLIVWGTALPEGREARTVGSTEVRRLQDHVARHARATGGAPRVVAHATDRLGVAPEAGPRGDDADHWLVWSRRATSEVLVLDPDGADWRATTANPPTPKGGTAPGQLVVRVEADPGWSRSEVELRVTAELRHVVRAPTDHVRVYLPLSDRGAIDEVVAGGAVLDAADLARDGGAVTLELPEVVPRGETVTVTLRWHDRWSTADGVGMHGHATQVVSVAPTVGSILPGDWRIEIGVPTGGDLASAAIGRTDEVREEDGRTWTVSVPDRPGDTPRITFGRWVTHAEPAIGDLPAVRVHLFDLDAAGIREVPAFTRTVTSFYAGLLPPLPFSELEVVQATDGDHGYVWQAHPGLVRLQKMRVRGGEIAARADRERLEENTYAHEIAHQYWGHVVRGERWIHETFAEVYSCAFLVAAYGAGPCEAELERDRETLLALPTGTASLTSPTWPWREVAYGYGPLVFYRTLRARIGEQAFWGALDGLARSEHAARADAELLQAAFEAVSGEDLGPFFDFHVHGGWVPALDATVDGARIVVNSDVPFGTLEVPLRIHETGADRFRTVWLPVVDGAGVLELEAPPEIVQLDPEGWLLTRRTRLRRK